MIIRSLAAIVFLVTTLISPIARAADSAAALFVGDRVIVRDRFSDEIVGYGLDLVLIPGNSLHFIMLDQPSQFNAAVDAFLAK